MIKIVGIISAAALIAGAAFAAMEVRIENFAFNPAVVVVEKGEDVRWVNLDQVLHTSTSDTGKWDSGDLAHGEDYERKFNQTGVFTYHCTYHPAMTGTVRVTGTPVEPSSYGRVKALFR
ncbi:MAG: plastocyanin/azurin family copper-binding protein [Candidatus Zixiibacteriota bacterium]|jgi:plastocyanin